MVNENIAPERVEKAWKLNLGIMKDGSRLRLTFPPEAAKDKQLGSQVFLREGENGSLKIILNNPSLQDRVAEVIELRRKRFTRKRIVIPDPYCLLSCFREDGNIILAKVFSEEEGPYFVVWPRDKIKK